MKILLLLLLLTSQIFAQNNQTIKEKIVVLDFILIDFETDETYDFTEKLRQEIQKIGVYEVVSKNQTDEIFKKNVDLRKCFSSHCFVRIGNLLNVQKIISCEITQIGDDYFSCEAEIFDLKKKATTGREIEDCLSCKLEAVKTSLLKNLAYKISNLTPPENTETTDLQILKGSILVTSEPSGAEIFVDEVQTNKKTPAFLLDLVAGDHLISLISEKFIGTKNVTVLPNKQLDLNIKLQPSKGILRIESEPEGAEIILNGKIYGLTPILIKEPKAGKYKLELSKNGFISQTEEINIKEESKTLSFQLQEYASLDFSKNELHGIKIYLNDELIDPRSNALQEIVPQKIELKIVKDGIVQQKMNFNLASGENKEIKFDFAESEGIVKITSNVSNARYFIGEEAIYPPAKLKVGTYKIQGEVFGYKNLEKTVVVNSDETQEINFNFIPTQQFIEGKMNTAKIFKNQAKKGLIATGSFLAASGVCVFLASNSYNNYKNAKSSKEADKFYSRTQAFDIATVVTFSAGVLGGIYSGYNFYRYNASKPVQNKISFNLEGNENFTGLALSINLN
ncbi:PEGA domain-containing protein [bacterium]|nr:PEGA domain-containing protein [bacterium]